MKTKGLIKKAALFSLSMLFALLSLSSCSADNSRIPQDTEGKEKTLTHPGQNLADKVGSFKLGDKDFTLYQDSEDFQNTFGEQSTVWYSKEIVDKFNKENGEKAEYQNNIWSYIVQDGVYCGDASFYQTDDSGTNVFFSFKTIFDYGDKETFDFATNISYTENDEVKKKDFPYEVDKIRFSVNGLTTGTATREQLEQYLGEGMYAPPQYDVAYSSEMFSFEDFILVAHFDTNDIFKAVNIFRTDFEDYYKEYFK